MGGGKVLAGEGYDKKFGFLGNFGDWTANPLLLSHGLSMWALATHYRITRDDKWLGSGPGSPLQAMIDGFDWVSHQRKRTKREVDGKKVPYWGLLPAASAHDWLAGNTIFNDAFCIYGMTEIVRLLREIKHPRAEEMANELNDYRKCLHDRYVEARDRARRLPLADGTTIPYVPRMVQELDWAKPDWTYTGYGALRAGAWGRSIRTTDWLTRPWRIWRPACPRARASMLSTRIPAGLYLNTADRNFAEIADTKAPRHYFWRHYVEYETMWPVGGSLFLARDDLPRFFEWFANNIGFVIHQDFCVGVESFNGVPSCASGEAERWLAIRNMSSTSSAVTTAPSNRCGSCKRFPANGFGRAIA